jgi:hypothetical protein
VQSLHVLDVIVASGRQDPTWKSGELAGLVILLM